MTKCIFVSKVVNMEFCWKKQVVTVDPGVHLLTKNKDDINRLTDSRKGIHVLVIGPEMSVNDNTWGCGDNLNVIVKCLVMMVRQKMFSID